MRPFFEQRNDLSDSRPGLKRGAKFAAACLYTVPSLAIFCLLAFALLRNDAHRFLEWLAGHAIAVLGGLFLVAYGLVALLRPDVVIRWIGAAYPDYDLGERNPSVQHFVRGLGAFLSAFGLFIFKGL